jgi:phosphoribosyl-ATP pyrophosphohydrolase/phosphoribosyl-AMP cyclohydrolase
MAAHIDIADVRFDEASGLVPAIVQDARDGSVLMLGYMNAEALSRTLETGRVTFWSRSRGRLWEKGETSGHALQLASIATDCDDDALLVCAVPAGPTCHTGQRSCFGDASDRGRWASLGNLLAELEGVVSDRDRERPPGSYTTGLLQSGPARIAQKVGEEAVETAIAAVTEPERLAEESADLLYHLLVLWRASGVATAAVAEELKARRSP